MKTLGQIAYEAAYSDETEWEQIPWTASYAKTWEAAAQAVRAAVIEECARVCDAEREIGAAFCAQAIRSLK